MFSLAAGELGVSKNTAFTIARLPLNYYGTGPSLTFPLFADAIWKIIADVVLRGIQNKAVISMSFGFSNPPGYNLGPGRAPPAGHILEEFYLALQEALNQGIVFVCSAGNSGKPYVMNGPVSSF